MFIIILRTYKLYSNRCFVLNQFRIDDGNWHKIKVLRKRRIGILQIDKDKPVKTRSPKGGSVLNTDGIIWIGTSKFLC